MNINFCSFFNSMGSSRFYRPNQPECSFLFRRAVEQFDQFEENPKQFWATRACEWLEKAAQWGYAPAKCLFDYIDWETRQVKDNQDGEGDQKADDSYAYAMYEYGMMCLRGEGGAPNLERARDALYIAIDDGPIDAQYQYAMMCLRGEGGDKDLEESRINLKLCAYEEHVFAMYEYAMMCLRGEGGDKDLEEALISFEAAALKGHVEAMYQCGLMCLRGQGGPRDLKKALSMFAKAADKGHARARSERLKMRLRGEGKPKPVLRPNPSKKSVRKGK